MMTLALLTRSLLYWRLPRFVLLSGFAAVLSGQTTTGSVSGIVSDPSGAQVNGAIVRIVNAATRDTRTTTTGSRGDYLFPSIPTGAYVVEAESQGFKTARQEGITLDVNQNARVDFTLQVGQ